MINACEAFTAIQAHRIPECIETVSLGESLGRILAEDVFSDLDQPPFNRVAMDGIAIRRSQLDNNKTFKILGTVAAGSAVTSLPEGSVCFEIMTGAALPEGADFVIRYEDLQISNMNAEVTADAATLSSNYHLKGSDYKKGSKVLSSGLYINSAHTALLASVGYAKVKVYQIPKIAIMSTGDELVDIEQIPSAFQIRWSNGICLKQELLGFGFSGVELHKVQDDEELIRALMQRLLQSVDVLILTGGVSAGKFDFVPKILKECNVREIFHKVAQRPGKPLWFGVTENHKVVFGLPGNPVSCLVNLRRYVIPFLQSSSIKRNRSSKAILASDVKFSKNLTYFCPVKISNEEGQLIAHPISGNGSGDFYQLRDSDGFMELKPTEAPFKKGHVGEVFLWGNNI